jgi:hypothetical protein
MDETDDELKARFARNTGLAGWLARLIVAGLDLDIVFLLIFSEKKSWKEVACGIFATVVIGLGVWLESIFDEKAHKDAAELQRRSDERVAEANARAAEANRIAQEASLELAKYRADRTLNEHQMARIADKVREFGPIRFDANVTPGSPESRRCLRFIEITLHTAGWNQVDWIGDGEYGSRWTIGLASFGETASVSNVMIQFLLDPEDPSVDFSTQAVALADALTVEGILAMARPGMPEQLGVPIHVLVGPKT